NEMIAKAEKQQNDPLAALKNAAEQVERLIKEQKETKADTQKADAAKQADQLPQIGEIQKDLARQTNEVKNQPMPANEDVKKALDNAAKSMDKAAQNLDTKKAPDAMVKQDQALKSLEDAKKALQDQI